MQIIIKHTRQGRDRTLELAPRHGVMLLKALLAIGAILWLLQQTVPVQPVAQAMPSIQVAAADDDAFEAFDHDTRLAHPVPDAVSSGTAHGDAPDVHPVAVEPKPSWLVGATQAWLARKAASREAAQAQTERLLEDAKADDETALSAYQQEHINALARKIGELEARLTQIDALGERLAEMAGVAPENFDFRQPPGQGGLLIDAQPMSLHDLGDELTSLQSHLAERTDFLSVLDARLTSQAALRSRTPSAMPILGYAYNSSSYGHRVDPITGRRAFHEGLDFAAPRGTPIVAAAGGVVVKAGYQAGYGKLVEIDHGNKLVTRYAHASKIKVKAGDLVYRGQKIATVGSTGRSTGPHLHFEVRVAGQAADPRLFLAAVAEGGKVASLAEK